MFVAKNGAGIYSEGDSVIIFDKGSDVSFINNSAKQNGAAIFMDSNSYIIFGYNAKVEFNNNKAGNGTIYSDEHSRVIFTDTCQVTFIVITQVTQYGAAIYSSDKSRISFTESLNVTFRNNVVPSSSKGLQNGGIIFTENNCHVLFEDNSVTRFINNSADFGAAILSLYASRVSFKGGSKIMFNDNKAYYCGILASGFYSSINFNDTVKVIHNNNTVSGTLIMNSNNYESAGTICTYIGANITFSGYSSTTFINNKAVRGGAAAFSESNVVIEEYATITIGNNTAVCSSGGALVCFNNSTITFKGSANVIIYVWQQSCMP